jgi:hypothetical protein
MAESTRERFDTKNRSKNKKHFLKIIQIVIAFLVIIIVSIVLYNLGVFPQEAVTTLRIQNGPIIVAQPSHPYNAILNDSSYKIYEINIPKNSSSEYVASEISYNVSSNSTTIYSLLLSERQLNLFQKGDNIYNPIYSVNGSKVSNILIENASSNNISLFLVVFPKNTTSSIDFNYTSTYIYHPHIFNSLSLHDGGFGDFYPYENYSSEVPFEVTNSSKFYLYGLSNQTLTYSIFDNSINETVYSSKPVTVAENKSNQYISINLTKGIYFIRVSNKHNSSSLYDFWYTESPYIINPYYTVSDYNAEGLASYGILNKKWHVIDL